MVLYTYDLSDKTYLLGFDSIKLSQIKCRKYSDTEFQCVICGTFVISATKLSLISLENFFEIHLTF